MRSVAAYKVPTRPNPRAQSHQSQAMQPIGYLIIRQPMRWRGAVAQVRSGSIIGQNPRCTVRLVEPAIANWHAQISLHATQNGRQQFSIRDLGSQSGTYVNGRRLSAPVWLQQDDIVRIGSYEFIFKTLF